MPSFVASTLLLLYCLVLVYGLFVVYLWVDTQRATHPVFPHLQDVGLPVVSSLLVVFMHRGMQLSCRPLAAKVIPRKSKYSQKVYESKLTRFGSAIFKFFFFCSLSTYLFVYALADAEWMPPALFGSGSTKNCWGTGNAGKDMNPMGWHFSMAYKVAISYHVSELVFQLLYELEKPDFAEMFAHHATTCFLVVASFLNNYVRIGSLVLFVHYVSDVPAYAAKIFVDTAWGVTTFLCLLAMLASWGWLRLWCLPHTIIRSVWNESVKEFADLGDSGMSIWLSFIVGLTLLFFLHCYWYFRFLQMGYGYVVSGGKTRDSQANLDAMDSNKEK